jgi:phage-related protein
MPIVLTIGGAVVTLNDDRSASVAGPMPATIRSFPVWVPPKNPDQEPDFQEKPNLYISRFGDGYSQESPAGLNHIDGDMALSWSMLTVTDEEAMRAFMRERGGYKPFWYGLPGDSVMWLWKCRAWSGGERSFGIRRFRAQLSRAYDLGA